MKVYTPQIVSQAINETNSNVKMAGKRRDRIYSAAEIQVWIVAYIAKLLEVAPDEVDVTIPFDRYGLDSSAAVGLTGDLADWLGEDIDPTLIYDYPTIEGLVHYLA
jgi:acyl carrier protein